MISQVAGRRNDDGRAPGGYFAGHLWASERAQAGIQALPSRGRAGIPRNNAHPDVPALRLDPSWLD